MVDRGGGRQADTPDGYDECDGAYGGGSRPNVSGVFKPNSSWRDSSVSSPSLVKATSAHPKRQQSSHGSSCRGSNLSQSRHSYQGHSAYNPAGVPVSTPLSANPPYEAPGPSSYRPRDSPEVTSLRHSGPVFFYGMNAFPPSTPPGEPFSVQHGSQTTFSSPEKFSTAGYFPYTEPSLGQWNLQYPTQAFIRPHGPLHAQSHYLPDARFQSPAHISPPAMQTTVDTQYAADGGSRPRGNPSRIFPMDSLRQTALRDGRPHVSNQYKAPGRQTDVCYQSPESWISNRPQPEGAPASSPRGRQGSEFSSHHFHQASPSSEPEPQRSLKRSQSKVSLRKQRVQKLREQHCQIKRDCSMSLEDLYKELVNLSQVQEAMDLWQYDSTRSRAASLVGFYQWLYQVPEASVNRLIKNCKGTGDDSASHHVFRRLVEGNMKTGNLILYFKEEGRQDIVQRLRELHDVCPVCDQLILVT